MRTGAILAAALALAGVGVVLTVRLNGVWLREAVRAVAQVLLPTAMAAMLLVLYFDWRRHLMRRVQAEGDRHDDLGEDATVTP